MTHGVTILEVEQVDLGSIFFFEHPELSVSWIFFRNMLGFFPPTQGFRGKEDGNEVDTIALCSRVNYCK